LSVSLLLSKPYLDVFARPFLFKERAQLKSERPLYSFDAYCFHFVVLYRFQSRNSAPAAVGQLFLFLHLWVWVVLFFPMLVPLAFLPPKTDFTLRLWIALSFLFCFFPLK